MLGELGLVQHLRWWHRNPVAIDECIEVVGARATGGAEELVEPTMNWCIGDCPRVVDHFDAFDAALGDVVAVFVEEGEADMPLSVHRGGIALVAEHLREGELVRFYEAGSADSLEDASERDSERHSSGEQAVAAGGADGGRRVGIGEPHAFAGESIDVWGFHLGFVVVATQVAVAEVVGEDEEDVGFGRLFDGFVLDGCGAQAEASEEHG